jgi:hypothetical protein
LAVDELGAGGWQLAAGSETGGWRLVSGIAIFTIYMDITCCLVVYSLLHVGACLCVYKQVAAGAASA